MKYLHYTKRKNIESIMKEGLLPKSDGLTHVFADIVENNEGMIDIYDMIVWRTFGVDDTSYLNLKMCTYKDYVVLRINAPEVKFELHKYNHYVTEGVIKPEHIEIIEPLDESENLHIESLFNKDLTEEDLNYIFDVKFVVKIEQNISNAQFLFQDMGVRETYDYANEVLAKLKERLVNVTS